MPLLPMYVGALHPLLSVPAPPELPAPTLEGEESEKSLLVSSTAPLHAARIPLSSTGVALVRAAGN